MRQRRLVQSACLSNEEFIGWYPLFTVEHPRFHHRD